MYILFDYDIAGEGGILMAQKMTSYFEDFLKEIRLTSNQVNELQQAHTTLRNRLVADEELSKYIETTFLQGSYKRSTAVRPKNGNRSDVDIVVVTKFDKDEYDPDEVLDVFKPFLEKYYAGKYRKQGRSWGIEMSHVDLDLVPTSSVSLAESDLLENKMISSNDDIYTLYESKIENINGYNWNCHFDSFFETAEDAEWRNEPLYIPDREAMIWDKTHPLEQIRWTQEKNKNCNGHYINVVKCIKWWRKEKYPDVKHPKSYPLEHFIGDCCPDGIQSVAEGITLALEKIVSDYPTKPYLADRGVPEHDVFARLSDSDYQSFYETVCEAAVIARNAFDADSVQESAKFWRQLFGNKFPEPPQTKDTIFTERKSDSRDIPGGRFA
jgi:predicted nucleotidyltransferase